MLLCFPVRGGAVSCRLESLLFLQVPVSATVQLQNDIATHSTHIIVLNVCLLCCYTCQIVL
jgi:hypothetical protein